MVELFLIVYKLDCFTSVRVQKLGGAKTTLFVKTLQKKERQPRRRLLALPRRKLLFSPNMRLL